MITQNQESVVQNQFSFELKWYFAIFILAVLSLITLNRNTAGEWDLTLGIRETTPVLVALAVLPALVKFLIERIPSGTRVSLDMLNKLIGFTVERQQEIDQKISINEVKHKKAGEAAKKEAKIESYINESQQADTDLKETVSPQELPLIQQIYKQRLIELVQEFNRNRHDQEKGRSSTEKKSLMVRGDEISYEMRSMAPLLFDQLEISAWLSSSNLGKQLAAIKYLDWAQDVEFAEELANRLQGLEKNKNTFQAYHILLALYSMASQLSYDYREKVERILKNYTPSGTGASSRTFVKDHILSILS